MIYYTIWSTDENKSNQHDIAYGLLKFALKSEYDINMDSLIIEKSEHGKPFFSEYTNLNFNVSHCNSMAACALSNRLIGVDCEKINTYREKVTYRVFSQAELENLQKSQNKDLFFYRIWTLKEAFVKCIGTGISYPMKNVSFDIADINNIKCSVDGFYCYQKIIDSQFVLSYCEKDGNTNQK